MGLSPHHGHLHELPLSHQAHGPIYDFGSSQDQNHLRIGCDWYNQQQHILIVVLIPGIWRLTSTNLRYGVAEPSVPSSSKKLTQGLDLQHKVPTKLGAYAGNVSTQINQCSHFLPIHYHWGPIRMSH